MDFNQILLKYYPIFSRLESIIFFGVLFLFAICLFSLTRTKKLQRIQAFSIFLFAAYFMVVLASTVFMRKPGLRNYELELFWSWKIVYAAFQSGYTHPLFEEIILNILLFVPLGTLLPFIFHRKCRWWLPLIVGILLSSCIEGLQLLLCRGLFEFDDILDNTLGCVLGQILLGNPILALRNRRNSRAD